MQHKIMDSDGVKKQQYNTLTHCRVQLAEQRYTNIGMIHYRTINLLKISSLQESHSNPPTPPPQASQQEIQACPPQVHQGGRNNEHNDRHNDNKDDDNGNDGQD
jgi:hypothetical protein